MELTWEEWLSLEIHSYLNEPHVYQRISCLDDNTLLKLAKGISNSHNITWPLDVSAKAKMYLKKLSLFQLKMKKEL